MCHCIQTETGINDTVQAGFQYVQYLKVIIFIQFSIFKDTKCV